MTTNPQKKRHSDQRFTPRAMFDWEADAKFSAKIITRLHLSGLDGQPYMSKILRH
jgi:hypothetical protein